VLFHFAVAEKVGLVGQGIVPSALFFLTVSTDREPSYIFREGLRLCIYSFSPMALRGGKVRYALG